MAPTSRWPSLGSLAVLTAAVIIPACGGCGNPTPLGTSLNVPPLSSSKVISIWGGAREAIALKQDGTVWTWGNNFVGELGIGTLKDQSLPVQVLGPGGLGTLNSVIAIMGGEAHNLALTSDGNLWAWGNNRMGQLGVEDTTHNFTTPVKVDGLSSVIGLGSRGYHSLAIQSDGSVWAWGWNLHGCLGIGSLTPASVAKPMKVQGVEHPIMVSAGYGFSVALLQDHTVVTWGRASQLGTGSATDCYRPTAVPNLTDVVSISAGWEHVLAVKSDGTVWAWGTDYWHGAYPGHGRLGMGTTADQLLPVQVPALTDIVQASCGDGFSLVLKFDGTVWAFGANGAGQLGNGDPALAERLTPVPVMGLTSVTYITARDFHAQAIRSDGSVWSWGSGVQGELGVGGIPRSVTAQDVRAGQPPPGYCRNSNVPVEVVWP